MEWTIQMGLLRGMMEDTGVAGLFIGLAVLIVLFGPARLAGLGKALGASLRERLRERRGDDDDTREGEPTP